MTSPTLTLAEALRDQPQLHKLADIHAELDPALTSWAARLDTLEAMQAYLHPGMRTLETGCGHSTVMFALQNVEHYCVTPARGETERTLEFCHSLKIDTSGIHFMIGNSQDELAKLPVDLRFDLVFIDGGHFFPIPCVDWYYADLHLKGGGILVLDDIRIPTVRMVYDFMRVDGNWEQVQLIDDTVFFRKLRYVLNLRDWIEQPYNQSYPDWSFLPLASRLKLRYRDLRNLLRSLRGRLRRARPVAKSS